MLSDAEIVALSKSWKPKDNFEVREYNIYHESWEIIRLLPIDAQTNFLNAVIALESASSLCLLAIYHNNDHFRSLVRKKVGEEYLEEALCLILANTGIEYRLLQDDDVVNRLIEEGKLVLKKVKTTTYETIIIDGESIFYLSEEYQFVKDFKEQINQLIFFAYLIELIKRNKDFTSPYATILATKDIIKQVSVIFEVDLAFYVDGNLAELNEKIEQLNLELKIFANTLLNQIHENSNYPTVFSTDDFLFSPDNIIARHNPSLMKVVKKVNDILIYIKKDAIQI